MIYSLETVFNLNQEKHQKISESFNLARAKRPNGQLKQQVLCGYIHMEKDQMANKPIYNLHTLKP